MQNSDAIAQTAKLCMEHISAHDQMAIMLGIEPVDCRPGYGKAIMPLDTRQCNGAGIAHGGAIFSLADIALALAANADGRLSLTLNASISFLNPGQNGPLTAEATEISASSKVAHYEIVVTDALGKPIAHCHGMAYRKHQSRPGDSLS